jgi:hypothetical protein
VQSVLSTRVTFLGERLPENSPFSPHPSTKSVEDILFKLSGEGYLMERVSSEKDVYEGNVVVVGGIGVELVDDDATGVGVEFGGVL